MTDQEKEDIERRVVEKIADCLEKQELTVAESQKIAEFVLREVDQVEDEQGKINFLQQLSMQWPIFSDLLQLESGKIEHQEEQLAAEEVLKLTKEGRIDEALSLAKSANRE